MVVRADELRVTHPISAEDFETTCAAFGIKTDQRNTLRASLAQSVEATADLVRDVRLRPDRQGGRNWLRKALKATNAARAALPSRTGDAGRWPLHVGGALLGGRDDRVVGRKLPRFRSAVSRKEQWP